MLDPFEERLYLAKRRFYLLKKAAREEISLGEYNKFAKSHGFDEFESIERLRKEAQKWEF